MQRPDCNRDGNRYSTGGFGQTTFGTGECKRQNTSRDIGKHVRFGPFRSWLRLRLCVLIQLQATSQAPSLHTNRNPATTPSITTASEPVYSILVLCMCVSISISTNVLFLSRVSISISLSRVLNNLNLKAVLSLSRVSISISKPFSLSLPRPPRPFFSYR